MKYLNDDNMYRIVIAGDLIPSGSNVSLFEKGKSEEIFGAEILNLFRQSDFSIFNLEGPLTSFSQPIEKTGPVIKAPKDSIKGIKGLGVKAVALANNHITDYQKNGYEDTINILNEYGIDYFGAGENCDQIKKHISITLGKKRVCIYNVSETFYNTPDVSSPGVNLYDEYIVCNEIKELKQVHDYVIVIYHGGTEEFPYATPLLRKRFHRMADCGADFITAQHTHCIGCFEQYKNAYFLYGQGNFLFARMNKDLTRQGLISEIIFSDKEIQIKQHLVKVTKDDVVTLDESQDLSAFYERSKDMSNYEIIEEKFKLFAYNRSIIKTRLLNAHRGDTIYYKIVKRISSKFYKRHILEKYKREQLLRIAKTLESERYGEDMLAVICYMLEKRNAQ